MSSHCALMGILNVTPDSFSDGGQFLDVQNAVDRGLTMAAEGAAILDLGAESTRPGSHAIPPREQLDRLLPVLEILRAKTSAKISIDTRSAEVAEACLREGADLINDISALRHDPGMMAVIARSKCEVVLMHMQGTPETMQENPVYVNVVDEIIAFFHGRIGACRAAGIDPRRLWLDPGVGFGKKIGHNLEIVRTFNAFNVFESNVLVVGVSRKGFLGHLTGEPDPSKRDKASIAAGLVLARKGASVLRVHDVAGHAAALKVFEALGEI